MHKRVDRSSEARFVSPAVHTAFARTAEPQPDEGAPSHYKFDITHCFTPKTNNSIHYWWFNSRDPKIGDPETDRFMVEAHARAYAEDVEALEWITEVLLNDKDPQHCDLRLAPDKPGAHGPAHPLSSGDGRTGKVTARPSGAGQRPTFVSLD